MECVNHIIIHQTPAQVFTEQDCVVLGTITLVHLTQETGVIKTLGGHAVTMVRIKLLLMLYVLKM